jgi:ABC-2 type transport system ATP-binding protein
MVHVEHLVYEYPGLRALDDVSFNVAPGSITALVGPNGAGKTTLLRCMAGLEKPLDGRILVDGVDVLEHPRQVHRRIGYLSDFFGLYEAMTVRQPLLCRRLAAVERHRSRRGCAGPRMR